MISSTSFVEHPLSGISFDADKNVTDLVGDADKELDNFASRVCLWLDDHKDQVATIKTLAYAIIACLSVFVISPAATFAGVVIGLMAGKEFVSENKGLLTKTYSCVGGLITECKDKPELGSRSILGLVLGAGALAMAPSMMALVWGADAGARLSSMVFKGVAQNADVIPDPLPNHED